MKNYKYCPPEMEPHFTDGLFCEILVGGIFTIMFVGLVCLIWKWVKVCP